MTICVLTTHVCRNKLRVTVNQEIESDPELFVAALLCLLSCWSLGLN